MKSRTLFSALVALGFATLPAGIAVAQSYNRPPTSTTPKVDPLLGAKKQVHDAEAEVKKVQVQMLQIKQKLQRTLEQKDDWKAAKAARDAARAEYQAALKPAEMVLHKKPEYIALAKQRDAAQARLDAANSPSGDKLSDADIDQASAQRTNAGLALSRMDKAMQDNDPKVLAAKAKMEQADKDWGALIAQVDESVKSDPDYDKALKDFDAAEQKLKQARLTLGQQAKQQRDAEVAAAKARAAAQQQGGSSGSSGSYR
jgi:chromosome segregation ATPase